MQQKRLFNKSSTYRILDSTESFHSLRIFFVIVGLLNLVGSTAFLFSFSGMFFGAAHIGFGLGFLWVGIHFKRFIIERRNFIKQICWAFFVYGIIWAAWILTNPDDLRIKGPFAVMVALGAVAVIAMRMPQIMSLHVENVYREIKDNDNSTTGKAQIKSAYTTLLQFSILIILVLLFYMLTRLIP